MRFALIFDACQLRNAVQQTQLSHHESGQAAGHLSAYSGCSDLGQTRVLVQQTQLSHHESGQAAGHLSAYSGCSDLGQTRVLGLRA